MDCLLLGVILQFGVDQVIGFGYFDGENLDSAVNIRYLEKKDGQLLYRSGGGITFLSDLESEYNELIEKIYVPVV